MAGSRMRVPVIALSIWSIVLVAWSLAMRGDTDSEHATPAATAGHDEAADAHATDDHGAPDTRQVVELPVAARDAVLLEMRIMLQTMEGALHTAARGDTAAMRTAVTPAGVAMAADHSIEELLPADWMQRAMATHMAFDSLPGLATGPTETLSALGRIAQGCNACHAIYRIEAH
ncbi:MAG TPA: hypothetical protein VFG84_07745 [Gemmatimonadaceae bacterium]|nr:hypothetical protein [Gemmatimonadaceae bacterium]